MPITLKVISVGKRLKKSSFDAQLVEVAAQFALRAEGNEVCFQLFIISNHNLFL